MARTGCEEHEVCRRSPSTGREGGWTWVTTPDSQGQPSGTSGEREQGVTSFAAHFLASALTALKGVRSCTGPWVTGEEQILGLKSWEMLLQLLASHHQSLTYMKQLRGPKMFSRRGHWKSICWQETGHIFLMFPLLAFSPSRATAARKGQGTGRTVQLPCSCQCLLHLAAAATWWSLVLLRDGSPGCRRPPNLGGPGAKLQVPTAAGRAERAAQREMDRLPGQHHHSCWRKPLGNA